MRQYLCEGIKGAVQFMVDRSKPIVSEARAGGVNVSRIPGRLSICDCVNGNNRRYAKRIWEKNLTPGSVLQDAIAKNAAFGLLEHPKDGVVTLESPISHQVTKAELIENRDPLTGKVTYEVVGEISLYDTPEGNKLKSLIEGGYNPLVSSRGYGSLNKATDGVDDVAEDYVCEGWDVVKQPSFEQATLHPVREPIAPTTQAHLAQAYQPQPTAECKEGFWKCKDCQCECPPGKPCHKCNKSCKEENLKESAPSSGASVPVASVSNNTNNQDKIMNLQELKGRVSALESLDASKLTPQRFAESISDIDQLHRQIAESTTDPKLSWEGNKLHAQLDAIAARISESVQAPSKTAKKLSEHNQKLMRVVEAVAQTALTYKKRLSETAKSKSNSGKLNEELVARGQGWKALAERRGAKLTALEKDHNTACEALDIMAKRYHRDTTELGKRLITLEFKEKAQTPAIQKQLKEATRLPHLVAIREALEGKKLTQPEEGKDPSKEAIKDDKVKKSGSPDEGKVAEAPGKVTTESKADAKAEAKPETKVSAPTTESVQIVPNHRGHSLTESVEMVNRLSKATA